MNWPSLSLFSSKPQPLCKGKVRLGAVTKVLLRDLPSGRIVVLQHRDLDEVIAQELIDCKVKAVINCKQTMSGTYPTQGPLMLIQQNIPIWEVDLDTFHTFNEHCDISIYEHDIRFQEVCIPCKAFTKEDWLIQHQRATNNVSQLLSQFIDNTLTFAMQEKNTVLEPLPLLELRTELEGKFILVVSRGRGYKRDLQEAKAFIRETEPILIGVDGGADALLECGFRPNLIIGDMDSVTDRALTCGAELVVHAYQDGTAPGMARVDELGLKAHIFPCFGTSEDAALLLANEKRGEWIVTVGAHTHMIDFMEKGREGMGSTLLVRMKIGARVVDIKNIGVLFRPASSKLKEVSVTLLLSLGLIALGLLQMHWITRRISHLVWQWDWGWLG
ncbi:hypothetical protein GK047_09145 [Paenibacillus sp. SYP-B3998]|uniref:Thiamine pyrophosphokinase n=1 Tax=Paenibacillus sp. SYP-B3998 TaxID=2678564 RepID=A0A6G3ZVN7_9BACL|nr:putative cytokinetic ring protein SteA [Paenibacillus sp. SYP-B3998]NEW06175.1 hypothetical protein [Paenibacillus sp. SYP-B3998]